MRRGVSAALLIVLVGVLAAAPATAASAATPASAAQAPWQQRLDRILDGKRVGVSVRLDGEALYSRRGQRDRIPASNQKLLLTMALLSTVDADARLTTSASAEHRIGTTVFGDLWLIGSGDPSLTGGGAYARALSYSPTRLQRLARQIRDAGITRIKGSVRGDTAAFRRDWSATGWKSDYPQYYAPLPSALAFDGNVDNGWHINDPEQRAARSLTRKLRDLGVRVAAAPGIGNAPPDVRTVAEIRSVRLHRIVRHMNLTSSNYHAEMLGKYLDAAVGSDPVTIAGGAAAVQEWAAGYGVTITAHDASGLSWANRASTQDLTRLLDRVRHPGTVRSVLARPGQGTIERRLRGTRVRAKTGTLPGHSALSGYVYLERRGRWAAFSVLCEGMSKSDAMAVEDRVVELLAERGR